jgi:hypothetical protein
MENEDLDYNNEFFSNICKPLFSDDKNYELLYKAIQLFYDPKRYASIKRNFNFNSKNIKTILFGYRYCLNELFNKKKKGIFYPLYGDEFLYYLENQFYPGNDTKSNNIYSSIVEHFKKKPNEGCYVCLCKEGGYYHSVKSGFPGTNELDKKCPKCHKNIGTEKINFFLRLFKDKDFSIVKRENYYRIFESEEEIKNIKRNEDLKKKLEEINYMTIDEYKEKYVINEDNIKKGVFIYSDENDINYFKNERKIVRNLSQITFRILNFILYSHLFFARLVTEKKYFDKYLPGQMGWAETLYECWKCLENQLLKENVDSIENFLSYSFVDLFNLLNDKHRISDYEDLIEIEDKLELEIKKIIKNYKEYIEDTYQNNKINKKKIEDKNSFISLLREVYTYPEYSKEEYPFYQYFYFTNYLDTKYINEKLSHLDKTNYPVLVKYLETKNNNDYSLNNLNLFNSVLNLISENYLNKITREYAEKTKLRNEKFYGENKLLIDKCVSTNIES